MRRGLRLRMQDLRSATYLPVDLPRQVAEAECTKDVRNLPARRAPLLCSAWPFASTAFVVAIAAHVFTGVVVLAWRPRSQDAAGGVAIPSSATCLRVSRHADYSTVDVMIGTPPVQMAALLRLDGIQRVNNTGRGLRLFTQDAVESSTVSCSVDGRCSDVAIVTDGRRGDHVALLVEFDYRHTSVEQQHFTTASRIPGAAGEFFMEEGYAYWLTPTHFCYDSATLSESRTCKDSVPVAIDAERRMTAQLQDIATNDILLTTPAASNDSSLCDGHNASEGASALVLFPEDALIETSWLSIADDGVYNTEPESVEVRRFLAEVGVTCAANLSAYQRDLTLYRLDCAPYDGCRDERSVPFRRVATSSLFLNLQTPGQYEMCVRKSPTLDGLPKLANSTRAFIASILRMMMITVAAAVVFVRSKKKTASSSWLFKNCVSISRRKGPMLSKEDEPENYMEDKWIGLIAVMCRVLVTTLRFGALAEDGQLRVCLLEFVSSALSLVHWTNRWYCLECDADEPTASKLGGSTAIVDSTAAVMLAFSQSPTLATSASDFDPTARMLVSLLTSIIVLTRCAFSAACCGTLWPTFWAEPCRRDYAVLLLVSAWVWCIQSAILAVTVCDLFVTPAAYSMSRATVGSESHLFVMRLALFFGVVCAGLPRLTSTARHILSSREHID